MVKTLQDFCLACIARNITFYGRLGNFLSLRHKEVLLERMCWHEQLTQTSTPSVVYHLFSHTLNRVNLSYSDQVDDKILELLGKSGCKPSSFTILACPNVTGLSILNFNAQLILCMHVYKLGAKLRDKAVVHNHKL